MGALGVVRVAGLTGTGTPCHGEPSLLARRAFEHPGEVVHRVQVVERDEVRVDRAGSSRSHFEVLVPGREEPLFLDRDRTPACSSTGTKPGAIMVVRCDLAPSTSTWARREMRGSASSRRPPWCSRPRAASGGVERWGMTLAYMLQRVWT